VGSGGKRRLLEREEVMFLSWKGGETKIAGEKKETWGTGGFFNRFLSNAEVERIA